MTSKADYFIALISFIVCFGPARTGLLVCLCQFEFFRHCPEFLQKNSSTFLERVDRFMARWLTAGDESSQLPEGSDFISITTFKRDQQNQSEPDLGWLK